MDDKLVKLGHLLYQLDCERENSLGRLARLDQRIDEIKYQILDMCPQWEWSMDIKTLIMKVTGNEVHVMSPDQFEKSYPLEKDYLDQINKLI